MKFNLKSILKTFKLNESKISMVLGAVVIIAVGLLVTNYFKDKNKGTLPWGNNNKIEVTETGKTHTVTKGENLWQIAEKETGSGYNWKSIAEANHLTNPSVIHTDDKLTIPEAKSTFNLETKTEGISGATYQVVKGDTLWEIAVRAYGDGYKWVEIANANNLKVPGLIHPGNILALPR